MTNLTHLSPSDRLAIRALLERLFAEHKDNVQRVFLFGSKARGDAADESDIDLLIVANNNEWEHKHKIFLLGARMSLEHDVLFNVYAIVQERWRWMIQANLPLYQAIIAEGVELTPELSSL